MQQIFVLPDDGELEEPSGAKIEPVGNRGIPSPLYYRHSGGQHSAAIEVKLEVWKGIPVCTEIRLTAIPDKGVHVRGRDLRSLESVLESSIEDWLSLVACVPMKAPKGRRRWRRSISSAEDRAKAMKAIREGRKQSRRTGKGHLQAVADAYNATDGPKGEAVKAALNVSMPTARRYIKQARKDGLIQ